MRRMRKKQPRDEDCGLLLSPATKVTLWGSERSLPPRLLRNFSNKRTATATKVKSRCFKLYRAYSISFNSSNVSNFFWTWILKDCIEVQKKKKKVVVLCLRPPRKIRHFYGVVLQWRQRLKEMYKKEWCTCSLLHSRFFSVVTQR